jgi:predicted MPP superfamily phosphohydrolase
VKAIGWGATAAASVLAYSYLEAQWFTLRRETVPVLQAGEKPIRVLHLSDIHLMPYNQRKIAWLRSLAALEPDLVVNTGDNLSSRHSVGPLLAALDGLLDVPGVFVFGSNDYFSPHPKNPAKYLIGGTGVDNGGDWDREPDLPFEELQAGFAARGWRNLNNANSDLIVNGQRLAFVGVDDPHIRRDDLNSVSIDPTAPLSVGVVHAPYLRVLEDWSRQGADIILAGHTHGGQLRVPGFGALVTNCDLDRQRARGLSKFGSSGDGESWLHVSAGCGTSPYTPVRFACRPEATLLTLTE